jgi:hypothetical protein
VSFSTSSSFEVELFVDRRLASEMSEVLKSVYGEGGCQSEIRDAFALFGWRRFEDDVVRLYVDEFAVGL